MHYGFVFKRGKRRKNWKKRFAVLTRTDGLRYYESAGVSSSLKGTIAVDEIQEVGRDAERPPLPPLPLSPMFSVVARVSSGLGCDAAFYRENP